MTITDFIEKVCGCKLLSYQKELLKKLEALPRGCKIVMGPKGRIYIIEKEIEK